MFEKTPAEGEDNTIGPIDVFESMSEVGQIILMILISAALVFGLFVSAKFIYDLIGFCNRMLKKEQKKQKNKQKRQSIASIAMVSSGRSPMAPRKSVTMQGQLPKKGKTASAVDPHVDDN